MSTKDFYRAQTPLRCPICESTLENTMIRDLGAPTAYRQWQLHAGKCAEHGWFQTEVVGKPPREIFAVTKPFGAVRRLLIDGREVYQFPTMWNDVPGDERLKATDPLDPQYWKPRPIS
jgi:hypothetical protein